MCQMHTPILALSSQAEQSVIFTILNGIAASI